LLFYSRLCVLTTPSFTCLKQLRAIAGLDSNGPNRQGSPAQPFPSHSRRLIFRFSSLR
jgi:hypothetical protein